MEENGEGDITITYMSKGDSLTPIVVRGYHYHIYEQGGFSDPYRRKGTAVSSAFYGGGGN